MRRAWLAPLLLGLSSAFASDSQQALADLLLRLDAAARQGPRLSAEVLRDNLGLSVDSDCVASATSGGGCWFDVSLPGLGWRGSAGDSVTLVSAVMLARPSGQRPCVKAAKLGAVLKKPPQWLPQIVGLGHQLEGPLPVFKPMPTWRYPGKSAGHFTEIGLVEDAEACVKQILLVLDMPTPQP